MAKEFRKIFFSTTGIMAFVFWTLAIKDIPNTGIFAGLLMGAWICWIADIIIN